MISTDEYGRPLPTGTVLDLQPYSPHTVIVGYNEWGQQVVGHNSKQQGRAVISWPEEFNDLGRVPFRVFGILSPYKKAEEFGKACFEM